MIFMLLVSATIEKKFDVADGEVENVNVSPPFDVLNGDTCDGAVTLKSDASPAVDALPARQVMVQEITLPMRTSAPVLQDSVESVVGINAVHVGPRSPLQHPVDATKAPPL